MFCFIMPELVEEIYKQFNRYMIELYKQNEAIFNHKSQATINKERNVKFRHNFEAIVDNFCFWNGKANYCSKNGQGKKGNKKYTVNDLVKGFILWMSYSNPKLKIMYSEEEIDELETEPQILLERIKVIKRYWTNQLMNESQAVLVEKKLNFINKIFYKYIDIIKDGNKRV